VSQSPPQAKGSAARARRGAASHRRRMPGS
jgi:hypothetical protein